MSSWTGFLPGDVDRGRDADKDELSDADADRDRALIGRGGPND